MSPTTARTWPAPAPALVAALIALAASATSLGNGFAYDDVKAIEQNEQIHSLADPGRFLTQTYWPPFTFTGGATLYRPLTSLAFALQWAVGGGRPWPFHLVNVLLYMAIAAGVWALARLLLPPPAAFFAAGLFAAHPVHVEAVGNSVGQSELWTSLLGLIAVTLYLARSPDGLAKRSRYLIYLCFALACLAKDNGLMLPGLLAVAELTVIRDPRPARDRFLALKEFWAVLAAIGIAYLALRTTVTGSLAGDRPHILIGDATFQQRIFTMLRVCLEWPRLLLWPAHLQADFSPHDFDRALSFGPAQLLGVTLLGAAAVFTWWAWRRQPVSALGMLWFGVAIFPVSNLLLKSGVVLAERTLFLPSVGIMLVVGGALGTVLERGALARRLAWGAFFCLAGLGVVRSAVRQHVWRDSPTFFARLVKDAPLNYRAHWMYAMNLYEHGNRAAGFSEIAVAIGLYPASAALHSDAGDLYRTDGQCQIAIDFYRQALAMAPELRFTRSRLASCYMRTGRFAEARAELRRIVADGYPEFQDLIPAVDSAEAAAAPPR